MVSATTTDKDYERTIEKILDAVNQVKYERKLAPIQITQVAAMAGISVRTLHRYFLDKEQMLYLAAIRFLQQEYRAFAEYFSALPQENLNGLARLFLILRTQSGYYRSDPIKAMLFIDAHNLSTSSINGMYKQRSSLCNEVSGIVIEAIKDGIMDGSIRKGLNPRIVCKMIDVTFNGMMQRLASQTNGVITNTQSNSIGRIYESYLDMLKMYLQNS